MKEIQHIVLGRKPMNKYEELGIMTGAIPMKQLKERPVVSVETGYFNPHLWVTYKCPNTCAACYLKALKPEEKSPDMKLEDLDKLLVSVLDYRKQWEHIKFTIYGAEPQALPPSYYHDIMKVVNKHFPGARFNMYSSLQFVTDEWIDLWKAFAATSEPFPIAASYDMGMRGEEYNKKLFNSIDRIKAAGVPVCVMSVVNKDMIKQGAKAYIDVLEKHNIIAGFSLKPFIPIRGAWDSWNKWAANMAEFSDFAIDCHQELLDRGFGPMSGMAHDICHTNDVSTNLGGETIFIDGWMRFLYMAYGEDKAEYLQEFGRFSDKSSFADIINSPQRKKFFIDQRMMAGRQDCPICDYAGRCLYEAYKQDYDNSGECTGAKKFVKWMRDHYGTIVDTNI